MSNSNSTSKPIHSQLISVRTTLIQSHINLKYDAVFSIQIWLQYVYKQSRNIYFFSYTYVYMSKRYVNIDFELAKRSSVKPTSIVVPNAVPLKCKKQIKSNRKQREVTLFSNIQWRHVLIW